MGPTFSSFSSGDMLLVRLGRIAQGQPRAAGGNGNRQEEFHMGALQVSPTHMTMRHPREPSSRGARRLWMM